MQMFLYLAIFLFGLTVGSFLNCIIYRLEIGKSFLRGRSFCPSCGEKLRWHDLIPILSFIILKRRCRYCKQRISLQYPLAEISTATIFVLISKQILIFNLSDLIYYWLTACFLIIIFVYDLKHYLIPDKIIYPAIFTAFLYRLFGNWISGTGQVLEAENLQLLSNALISAFLASIFFLSIILISRGKWMGLGDIKLAFLMGLILGFPRIIVALFLAFFIGAIIGLGLILLGRKTLKSEIPFGPFLIIGTLVALFWGSQIVSWYFKFFI